MHNVTASPAVTETSRRDFLKAGAAGVALAATLGQALPARAFAGGSDTLRVGLVGCGGRGSGAAANALAADPGAVLVAMGDVFPDHLESSLKGLQTEHGDRVQVDDDHRFIGFDAYQKVIEACDVVLLCTPPHFRPAQLKAAVDAGRHIFCEKPVAVDAPGIRSVMETAKLAAEKKLSLVSGLCWRYHPAIRAAMEEVHSGRIGDIVALRCSYFTKQLNWYPRQESWSDMEYQLRNWQYMTWLSGDHIVEQHIHSLDKMVWATGGKHPVSAFGTGGRLLRPDGHGNVWDHFAIEYDFGDGLTCFGRCRQQDPCPGDVSDNIYGTKGTLAISSQRVNITGSDPWRYRGEDGNMYVLEHEALFRSIREGQPINNGEYMSTSTMMAMLGREAAYSGKPLQWDELLASKVSLGPDSYDWGNLSSPEIPLPGGSPRV